MPLGVAAVSADRRRGYLVASALGALLLSPPASAASVTGFYVGATTSLVEMVQLVQTPDGRLAGRVETVSLDADGELRDEAFSVDGAADHGQLTFSEKSLITPGAANATGFIDHDLLDLSWRGGHLVLRRGDAYAFEAAVTGLRGRSLQIKGEKAAAAEAARRAQAERTLLSQAQTAANQLSDLEASIGSIGARLADAEAKYAELGPAIGHRRRQANYLSKVDGWGGAAMDRGGQAQGMSLDLNSVHGDVVAFSGEIRARIADTHNALSQLELSCRDIVAFQNNQTVATCAPLSEERERLRNAQTEISARFEHAESAYQAAIATSNDRRGLIRRMLDRPPE